MKQFFSLTRASGCLGLAGLLACAGCGRPAANSPGPAKSAQSVRGGQSANRDLFGNLRSGEDHLASNPSAISAQPTTHSTPVLSDSLQGDREGGVVAPATATKTINSPFDLFDATTTISRANRNATPDDVKSGEMKAAEVKPANVAVTKAAEQPPAKKPSLESFFNSPSTAAVKTDATVPHADPPKTPVPATPSAEAKSPPPVAVESVARTEPEEPKPREAAKPVSIRTAQPLAEQTTMLPWARLAPDSPEMEAVCDRVDQALKRGCTLAERGATYSARAEFILALRMLAEGLDARQDNKWHAKALVAGLLALREVDDFQPAAGRAELTLSIEVLIGSHRTPVCQDIELQHWTPAEATDRYHEYAQQQLAAAMGGESLGSLALYTFARLHTALDGPAADANEGLLAKAMTCHCAALLVDPRNFMAANELGVLLARRGEWNKALSVLNQSLATTPQVVTWENLAVVYEHMGNAAMGQTARKEAAALAANERQNGQGALSGRPNIRWLDPEAFAATTSQTEVHDAATTSKIAAPATADKTGSWLPWSSTKR